MSRIPQTSNIPPPPPLPPPFNTSASDNKAPKVPLKPAPPPPVKSEAPALATAKYGKALSSKVISKQKVMTRDQLRETPSASLLETPAAQVSWKNPEVTRNNVPYFDEEKCTDPDDDYYFPCCMPPTSPRHPPKPRPLRDWDPVVLPGHTYIPTSIGRPCRRCGKLVYVAELHLSSRGAYHTECFKCCLCGKSLDSWSMSEFKGEVFCKGCYRRNFSLHGCGFGVGAGVLQTP